MNNIGNGIKQRQHAQPLETLVLDEEIVEAKFPAADAIDHDART